MGFSQICVALYDYAPQDEGELELKEGELVYILGKSEEEDWSKAKKKAIDDDDEEPVGLVPNNYVEEAQPLYKAKALYDYTKQTDEEISLTEDAVVSIYDTSDPDWPLVGCNKEFGFAPANYIGDTIEEETAEPSAPALPSRTSLPEPTPEPDEAVVPAVPNPAANLASIISKQGVSKPAKTVQFTPEASEDEGPPPGLPQRHDPEPDNTIATRSVPQPSTILPPPAPPLPQETDRRTPVRRELSPDGGIAASPPLNRAVRSSSGADGFPAPGGFHLYNINEMVTIMGKQKKMPTTLGINLATGMILISPEKERDGPQQEWTAEKLKHYSIEGKHVFVELVQPSRSIDFHAGAKDTATEIVSALGELSGMFKAEGLREVFAAGSGQLQKKGHMLYDFTAHEKDEVTVAEGDAVIVLDDASSEEWWKVRRVKNGKEGVVPGNYVEIDNSALPITAPSPSIQAGKSFVEQNRREEERLAKEALEATQKQAEKEKRNSEVGPGLKLPDRGSSLVSKSSNNVASSQRSKRQSRSKSEASRSKPDSSKVRTWTDRSNTFKVEAQFLALKDGKIHLHKLNGIKIAVPVAKMSVEDLEYVEKVTNQSLNDDKPPADTSKKSQPQTNGSGARIEKKPDYDWFDFFLRAGVSPYQCERYSFNFNKDSIDESILEDLTPDILRNLGLKEGDIIRVMKYLDTKYSRTNKNRNGNDDGASGEGGLFSGSGGTLKNNTRKGRPAPPVQTNDVVDPEFFKQGDSKRPPVPEKDLPSVPATPAKDDKAGFDDNAWDVKPQKPATQPVNNSEPVRSPTTTTQATVKETPAPQPSQPPLTGAMKDLSLLDEPLIPVVTHSGPNATQPQQPTITQPQPQPQPSYASVQSQPQQQPIGASPALFNQVAASQPTGITQQPINTQGLGMMPQPNGQFQSQTLPRQRPQAPLMPQQQGAIMPPPPVRPVSAPLSAQQTFAPPPLQPQLTGMPYQNTGLGGNTQQTLNDMARMRMQQQFTGFAGQQFATQPLPVQPTGFAQGLQPQMTGVQQQNPYILGQQMGSPFADPRFGQQALQPQFTGFNQPNAATPNLYQPLAPQQTGNLNSILPPALQPQLTGINGTLNRPAFGQPPVPTIPLAFQNNAPMQTISAPPMPPMPTSQPTIAPLQPQKTGPAPNISFGMQPEVKKLMPQPTGKRANLSQATPDNPFGF